MARSRQRRKGGRFDLGIIALRNSADMPNQRRLSDRLHRGVADARTVSRLFRVGPVNWNASDAPTVALKMRLSQAIEILLRF
jgi:hypothetical protein